MFINAYSDVANLDPFNLDWLHFLGIGDAIALSRENLLIKSWGILSAPDRDSEAVVPLNSVEHSLKSYFGCCRLLTK